MTERPRAPLTEFTVLAALGLAVVGFLSWGSERAAWALLGCMALGVLAGFELCLREHLSARRRHSGLLAGTVMVGATIGAFLVGSPALALAAVAAVAFGTAFVVLERAFPK
jgi:hypothetical protein